MFRVKTLLCWVLLAELAAVNAATVVPPEVDAQQPAQKPQPTQQPQIQSTTKRINTFDLVAAPAGFLPFYAQDLVVAKNTEQMAVRAEQVTKHFQEKRGHAPANELETAIAVVDWVSDHLRHPYFWPEDPALPRFYNNNHPGIQTYKSFRADPLQILKFAMSHDVNDPVNYAPVLCTHQNAVAAGLMNYFGMHARICTVEGHDTLEYFSFVHHRWIWMDATFNEHYVEVKADDSEVLLGARELNALTLAGKVSSVRAIKHGSPTARFYKRNVYIGAHPHGVRYYAPHIYMNNFNNGRAKLPSIWSVVCTPAWPKEFVPFPGETTEPGPNGGGAGFLRRPRTTNPAVLDYPLDTLAIAGSPASDAKAVKIQVQSFLPYTTAFEVYDATHGWVNAESIATPSNGPIISQPVNLDFGSGLRKIRALDGRGNPTQEVILELY
jgi:hypothetical protein